MLGGGNNHRDDLDFDYPDLASQTRSEDDKGSYIKGHPRCDSSMTLHTVKQRDLVHIFSKRIKFVQ